MNGMPLDSLLNPDVYPEPTECVRLLQTHVSYIFITDNFVYKIKKPVDFGFLNFTTIDRRRFFCDEEVRLNRRLCPDIYLGVVEVRESAAGATFVGDGKVIDYAVMMKRLPAELMLDRMLAEDRVTEAHIREIARVIGAFHLNAEHGEKIDAYGSVANIRSISEDNFRQVGEINTFPLDKADLDSIRNWIDSFIAANGALFAARVSGGFIRDCDGDIHLENICMTSPVCIFDCIEFNERFRYIDTAADIAFFVMDLDFHGKGIFSHIFIDEYIRQTGDTGIIRLLDFYRVNRAVVRGKVEGLRLLDPHIPVTEKLAAAEKAARYLRLARGYVAREGRLPALIITCGLTGSGKSFVAAALAFELGMQVLSSDEVRKELADIPPGKHCIAGYDEEIYTPAFNEAVYQELRERCGNILQAGGSVIVDATFRRKMDRSFFGNLAGLRGIPFYILQMDCPEALARQRLDERGHDPSAVSDGRWEIYFRQRDEFEAPDGGEGRVIAIDTSRSLDDNIREIIGAMENADGTRIADKGAAAVSEP
ncbi:MAG TPA: AAA family ATPase [Geobacteraceae bacterium]|nr:AAA family ATPase [Geobacteraceae bacterium]